MAQGLGAVLMPSPGASTRAFRVAGALYLVAAVLLGMVLVGLLAVVQQPALIPVALLPTVILWLIGIHRVLWGGVRGTGTWGNLGRVAGTATLGYMSLAAVSALVGALAAVIRKAT